MQPCRPMNAMHYMVSRHASTVLFRTPIRSTSVQPMHSSTPHSTAPPQPTAAHHTWPPHTIPHNSLRTTQRTCQHEPYLVYPPHTTLRRTAELCIMPHNTTLRGTTPHCTTLCYRTLRCTAVDCAVHDTTPNCTTPSNIPLRYPMGLLIVFWGADYCPATCCHMFGCWVPPPFPPPLPAVPAPQSDGQGQGPTTWGEHPLGKVLFFFWNGGQPYYCHPKRKK